MRKLKDTSWLYDTLLGDVLTVIDAVLPHSESSFMVASSTSSTHNLYQVPSQHEAIKSLVRMAFKRNFDDYRPEHNGLNEDDLNQPGVITGK